MGGKLWVESNSDGGSSFFFTIIAKAAPASPKYRQEENRRNEDLYGKRLLIVEDNATHRKILALQAQSWGMLRECVVHSLVLCSSVRMKLRTK